MQRLKTSFKILVKCFGRQATFSAGMERVPAEYMPLFDERFSRLTFEDVRKLAFDEIKVGIIPLL